MSLATVDWNCSASSLRWRASSSSPLYSSLPALRIKGVYLALVTLALGLVFPQIIKWPKLTWLTGGAKGLDKTGFRFTKKNPTYEVFGWNPWGNLRGQNVKPFYYWVGLIIVVIVYLICRGVVKSRMGRSLIAVRDNSTAAAVMGVNLAVTKGIVFGLSAAMCAMPAVVAACRWRWWRIAHSPRAPPCSGWKRAILP